jgi:hypothetical protein
MRREGRAARGDELRGGRLPASSTTNNTKRFGAALRDHKPSTATDRRILQLRPLCAMHRCFLVVLASCTWTAAAAQPRSLREREALLWREAAPRPALLFLGLFHFAGEQVDSSSTPAALQPQLLSARRQRELRVLRARIIAWRPTKIAVEYSATRQSQLDAEYARYRSSEGAADSMRRDPDELYQLAFPVAAALGHATVYAVGERNPPPLLLQADSARSARFESQTIAGADTWDLRYERAAAMEDSLRAAMTITDFLRWLNSDVTQARAVGRWLIDTKRGNADEPIGADGFISRYFVRNVRIFSHVQRIITTPIDRVLILHGNTHGYFLRQLIRASPEYELRDAHEVLGGSPTRSP